MLVFGGSMGIFFSSQWCGGSTNGRHDLPVGFLLRQVGAKEPHHQQHDVVKVTKHVEYSHGSHVPVPHDLVQVTKHVEYSHGHVPPVPHEVTHITHVSLPHDVVRVTKHTEYSHGYVPPVTPVTHEVTHVSLPHDVVRVSKHTEYSPGYQADSKQVEYPNPTGFNCSFGARRAPMLGSNRMLGWDLGETSKMVLPLKELRYHRLLLIW